MSEQIFTAEQQRAMRQVFDEMRMQIQRERMVPNSRGITGFTRRSSYGQTSYTGSRNYNIVLGRKAELEFTDYHELYERGGLAGQIVDIPGEDTWGEPPAVTENDEEDTEFTEAWNNLVEKRHVWEVLRRADQLSGIGQYGILLFGLAGKGELVDPVEAGSVKGPEGLLYLRPMHQGAAEIAEFETDKKSARCGYPLLYRVTISDKDAQAVHHSRVLHVAEHRTDSEVYGRPRMKRAYDSIEDMIYKVLGGSSESSWLNQRKGAIIGPREGYTVDLNDTTTMDGFKDQLEAYVHDLARFILSEGMEVQEIGGVDVWDPAGQFDVLMKHISAITRIPMHILFGSAAGELSSAGEDTKRWAGVIRRRQNNWAGPRVLRPFIDRLIWYGVLPEPTDGYEIGSLNREGNRSWPSIIQVDEEQQASVTLKLASAVRQLADPATGKTPLSRKEQRVLLGEPAEVPDDMVDDEPEPEPQVPAQPSVPEAPAQPEGEPGLTEVPELVEPPGEPDEEAEAARVNALFVGSHVPVLVNSICPLCGFTQAESYEGHGPLLRCANPDCRKTYDPTVEGPGVVIPRSNDADAQAA